MNRIILIGNGFDLAHGLKTTYRDFLDNYWGKFGSEIFKTDNLESYEDKQGGDICARFIINRHQCTCKFSQSKFDRDLPNNTYKELRLKINSYNDKQQVHCKNARQDQHRSCNGKVSFDLVIDNSFLKRISDKGIENWVDVECEYYEALKEILLEKDSEERNVKVNNLNKEFDTIKMLLEKYLKEICDKELPNIQPNNALIESLFIKNGIERKCVALSKQTTFSEYVPAQKEKLLKMTNEFIQKESKQRGHNQIQASLTGRPYIIPKVCEMSEEELENESEQSIERMGIDPQRMMVLNFNYTPTFEKLYGDGGDIDILNIHGEINNPSNPLIFGYGDELDEDYKEIERSNDNDMLDNIKHIHYQNTTNYRRFLEFLQLGPYQVFIMGHSCGNSDRTLLNTLFEHSNCSSIKTFYYKWVDEESKVAKDNYSDIYKNISRNFNNKQNLRDIVANKTYCEPMPQN